MRPDLDTPDRDLAAALGRAAEPLPDDARARIKSRVMDGVRPARAGWTARLAAHRLAAAFTTVAVLSGGTAYAANAALPGDPLYAVKRAGENALVALLPPGRLEQQLLVGLAARRAEEAATLARRGATAGEIEGSLDQLRSAIGRAAPAEGALSEQDRERIRENAEGAPAPAREQIRDAVDAPTDGTGSGPATAPSSGGTDSGGSSDQGDTGSGEGTGSGSGPGDDSGSGGSSDGSGSGQGPQAPKSGDGSGK